MTAAFDVVNHELLIKRLRIMGLPHELVTVVKNWLEDRIFFCEVNGKVSAWLNLDWGTIQGSILGPILFALFTSPLGELIPQLVTYADDNYTISAHESLAQCIDLCQENTTKMTDWLKGSGLAVNESKTEFCVFHKNDMRRVTISLKGRQHQTKNQIKILGIIFDTKLTWTEHVKYAIAGANKAKQALKLIAKYFTEEELLKLSTAYFYGRLYYGAKVWLLTTLNNLVRK